MYRWTAFALFLSAAFAWPLPWTDRVGTAALGFAFLALAVGRGPGVLRPSTFSRAEPEPIPAEPGVDSVLRYLDDLAPHAGERP